MCCQVVDIIFAETGLHLDIDKTRIGSLELEIDLSAMFTVHLRVLSVCERVQYGAVEMQL